MTAFADSSASMKLYADEPGRAVVRRRRDLVVAEIAGVEVPPAFWRKHRLGEIAAADARVLTAAFQPDLFGTSDEDPLFLTVSSAGSVLREAAELVARHPCTATTPSSSPRRSQFAGSSRRARRCSRSTPDWAWPLVPRAST